MQTQLIKTSLVLAFVSSGFMFSSFTSSKTPPENNMVIKVDWKEYDKVSKFAWEHVCKPISLGLTAYKKKGSKANYFSRCPSGYEPEMITEEDSVLTNKFVNGQIVYYKGCEPTYVCDFKINVDKHYAVVRSKGSKKYMSVQDWIKMKNDANTVKMPEKSIVAN